MSSSRPERWPDAGLAGATGRPWAVFPAFPQGCGALATSLYVEADEIRCDGQSLSSAFWKNGTILWLFQLTHPTAPRGPLPRSLPLIGLISQPSQGLKQQCRPRLGLGGPRREVPAGSARGAVGRPSLGSLSAGGDSGWRAAESSLISVKPCRVLPCASPSC